MTTPVCSLKGDRTFQQMRRGKAGHAKLLSLRWRSNREMCVRVGIVVSKKVGNAVVRNRVRRRLREALRALTMEKNVSKTFDLVVIARPVAADADYWQLKDALRYALKKGGAL